MIKLKNILNESTHLGTAGESAGQIWPFAQKEAYAKRWEKARMNDLFKGSLKGMEIVDNETLAYITYENDINDVDGMMPAGLSGEHWHKNIPDNVIGEWELVKYMFDMENVDRLASDKLRISDRRGTFNY